LRRRRALQLRAGVAAGPDLAARALHAVDELAIEIADLRRQPPLAEIVVIRRRRLVVGEVENADVNRGNHDLGVLAGIESFEPDRNLQRRIRPDQRRRRKLHTERAGLLVDAEPF
jgi:hypothetical protein